MLASLGRNTGLIGPVSARSTAGLPPFAEPRKGGVFDWIPLNRRP
jgi:hypothetical protein